MMINVNKDGMKLTHFWSKCVSAGRANEGLRAEWQKQFKMLVKDCGFKYIRFHGLLHDDMCVYRIIDGKEVYNFQYIDELFDMLLENGVRPVVEFGFMPEYMASGTHTQFWWKGNVTPPADWSKWGELIDKLVRHWIDRYGLNEIKKWYFEVWNEPNLHPAFWTGGKTQYFKMYEITTVTIKKINAELKVGGPATSNFVPDNRFEGEFDDTSKHMTHKLENLDNADWQPVWFKEFIDFCYERKLPVDFFSAHPYPTDFALDGHGETTGRSRKHNSTTDDLRTIRKIVDESPYSDAEIILTEWSSSPSSRDNSHDYPATAAYIVKANVESRGFVDALSYWTFTDIFEELGAGNTAFHGGFGMINYQGIKKPAYYAYKFLNCIGDTELEAGNNYIVTKDSKDNKVQLLAWNYASDTMKTAVKMTGSFEEAESVVSEGKSCDLNVGLSGFNPNTIFSVEKVNSDNGCAMGLYKKLGYPSSLKPEMIKLLKAKADATEKDIISADKDGILKINMTMKPWEILLIREL